MSLTEHLKAAHQRHQSLRTHIEQNAVPDTGINMRNGKAVGSAKIVPIMHFDHVDVFVPKHDPLSEYGPDVLGEYGPRITPFTPAHTIYRVETIQRVVCAHYKVSRTDLLSARRTANLVKPRFVAMYLSKKLTLKSLPEIGRRFGGKDHTSVLNAVRKTEWRLLYDSELNNTIELLKAEIRWMA